MAAITAAITVAGMVIGMVLAWRRRVVARRGVESSRRLLALVERTVALDLLIPFLGMAPRNSV
jgi:hypothetical protein